LSYYSLPNLEVRAQRGDLFLCHVLTEGRALYDPDHSFDALRAKFRLRTNYAEEIEQAAALGWLLSRFSQRFSKNPLAAKRAAWVVRTIVIARSAEAGRPEFAARRLAALAPIPETMRVIKQKSATGLKRSTALDLRRFLEWTKAPDPTPDAAAPEDYRDMLEATSNTIGIHFLNSFRTPPSEEGYG